MRFNDAVIAVVLIAFASAVIAYATTFPRLHGQDYGPDLFPILIGAGLIGCGALLLVKGISERATVPLAAVGDWARDRARVVDLVLLVGGIAFYILASGWLGFVPVAFAILLILLVRLGTGWVASVGIAAATTLLLHALFAKLLLVPLPWGILQPFAW